MVGNDGTVSSDQELLWLREFKAREAVALMRRFGAHSLGIGRLAPGDDQDRRLALLIYLDADDPDRDPDRDPHHGSAEPVPAALEYLPEGLTQPVMLPTRVIDAPRAVFE